MVDKKLTEADQKVWDEYTKRISSHSPMEYKKPPIVNISDYLNNPKNFPELPKAKKKNSKCYEARLDLHGMTRNEAHKALETFLCTQKIRGTRCVLVITGKGHGKGDGLGILKRKVPLWLEVSKMVRSWSTASLRDGGEGALYVYIK